MTHRLRHAALALSLIPLACTPAPEPPPEPSSGTLAIRCGSLLDGIGDVPLANATVLVVDERIAAVGADVEVPPGTPTLDLSEHTCLPGLLDLHTHLADRDDSTADLREVYTRTDEEIREIGRVNAARTLAAGFTTVRDVGTYHAFNFHQSTKPRPVMV